MRKKNGIILTTTSLMVLSGGAVWADQGAPAKPAIPSISDILMSSGITATGYVDATFSAFGYSGSQLIDGTQAPHSGGYDTFNFQQAGLTLAYQPSSGFGALINPVVTPYGSVYANNDAPDSNYYLHTSSAGGGTSGAPTFAILQGYAQYATGPWTVIAGKFSTLAGAEVYAPPGNTNVTRSLLFTFEPLTHTGVRATFAPNSKFSFIVGANNGWFNAGDESSFGAPKTLEVGVALNPTKTIAWTIQNYYGSDLNAYGEHSDLEFFDTVLTWTATSQLSLIGSFDYGNVASSATTPSADWWGVAGYLNYQFNPKWRVSLRAEYLDDEDGYLTEVPNPSLFTAYSPLTAPGEEDLKEVTLTFGWDPVSHLEFRIEGRYDDPDSVKPAAGAPGVDVYSRTEQGWLEALWKF